MNKKKIIIIGVAAVAVIAAIILAICVSTCSAGNKSKQNTYNLARTYAERGEYDRALTLLDQILIKDASDAIALDLFDQILGMKKDYEEGREVRGFRPDSFKIEIDTKGIADGITNAMQDSLDSMKNALEQSNKNADANRQAADESRKAMENLVKIQEEQSRAEEARRIADEEKRAKEAEAEEERKAQEAAAAEKKRIADEKRKAEEEAVAKKNAKLKAELDAVNENIQKGETALATGNIEEAIKYFQKAENGMPSEAGKELLAAKESQIAQYYFDAAEKATTEAEKQKLMEQAVAMAQKAIADNPKDSSSHYILAQDAMNKKKWDIAINELNKAIQNDPSNYLYYYDLGKIQFTTKKYSEAAISFDTACKKKSDFAPARYNLGLSYLRSGNESAALEAFRKTIDISPRHEKAYLEEARILAKRGDYKGSIAAYENVLAINNINTTAQKELGSVYYQAKRFDKAEESYKKAISMMKDGEEKVLTKYNLSTVLYDANKAVDAEKYAKEAYDGVGIIKNDNSKASIIYNYALMMDSKNNIEEAIPLYLEVLKHNPNHVKTKINLGVMYMNLEPPDVDTALSMFLAVYKTDNKNFEANNNLGSAYLQKNDYKNAIMYFQNALRIDNKNNAVRANLAKAYAQDGDYDNAKTVYTELIKLDNKNWDGYIELAKCCMQLGDNANAEKYLVYVQEKNPGYKSSEIEGLLAGL